MSDGESLFRAILDEPDEDVHRLVYADWLEENGDAARADFIRAQCALARFHDEGDPFTTGLPAERLRPELRVAWLAPLLSLGVSDWKHPLLFLLPDRWYQGDPVFVFRRGFVDSLRLFGDAGVVQFLPYAAAVFERTPLCNLWIAHHRLFVTDSGTEPYEWGGVSAQTLAQLVALPQMAKVQYLDLRGHHIREAGAQILLDAPHFSRGIRLRLEHNGITADVRQALEARFGSGVSTPFTVVLPPISYPFWPPVLRPILQ
jgi:uncharacterized protein (TIGR02996 family)